MSVERNDHHDFFKTIPFDQSQDNDVFVPKPTMQIKFICKNFEIDALMNYYGSTTSRRRDGRMFIGTNGGHNKNDLEITCAGLVNRHCMLSFED